LGLRRGLTAASVERIKPPSSGQKEYFDKGFPGFALRVSYGGGKSFVFFYRINGRLRRMSLGTYPALSLAKARDAWRAARLDVAQGRDPALSRKRGSGVVFADVVEDWFKRDQAKNRSVEAVRRQFAKDVLPAWGNRSVTDIGRRDVLDVIDSIVDRGSVIAARRLQSHIHRFFRWCVSRGIIEVNPAANLDKPGSETKRDRVLTDAELVSVWKSATQLGWPFGTAIQLLILTGARRNEIGCLRWPEVDGEIIKIKSERTKNGEPHDIPLSPAAMDILANAPRIASSDYVFTTNGKVPIRNWARAKTSLDAIASIEPWRIHDLRRTVATGLQKLGIGLQVVEALLGHIGGSRGGIVGVYQRHNYADEKRGALRGWSAYVMALVEGRQVSWPQ
jgi:integrase